MTAREHVCLDAEATVADGWCNHPGFRHRYGTVPSPGDTVTATLAQWAALTEGATEGPWRANGPDEDWAAISSGPDSVLHAYLTHERSCDGCECGDEGAQVAISIEDAEFIAHARTAMPALIAAVKDALGLHRPHPVPQEMIYGTITACSECGSVDDAPVEWPCPTVQAAQKWLGGGA